MRSRGSTWSTPDASLPVAIEVLRRGPISRVDVARRLQLTRGSLSRLSGPLLANGLLHEVGEVNDGRVGRPTQLLDVDADTRHFVGIKVREREIITALTNLRGSVVRLTTTPLVANDPPAVVAEIAEQTRAIADGIVVSAIGIGLGARIRDRMHVVSARFLGWQDVPLSALVAEATGIPVVIDNDVLAFTEYEHWFGDGRDDDRFAVVTLGAGTGYGLVANGGLVTGEDYGIGLVGHWPLDPAGPVCALGHRGCASSMLDADALARRVSVALGQDVTPDEVLTLAADGQPAAVRVVEEACVGLGRLLAAICNLTMPQRIILAGEGVGLARIAPEAIARGMQMDRSPEAQTPPIVITSGDNAEWCRGAAALAIQAYVRGLLDG